MRGTPKTGPATMPARRRKIIAGSFTRQATHWQILQSIKIQAIVMVNDIWFSFYIWPILCLYFFLSFRDIMIRIFLIFPVHTATRDSLPSDHNFDIAICRYALWYGSFWAVLILLRRTNLISFPCPEPCRYCLHPMKQPRNWRRYTLWYLLGQGCAFCQP